MPVSPVTARSGLLLKSAIAATFLFAIFPRILPLKAFFYAPDFPDERLLFLDNAGFFFYIALMACLVVALVNFEITIANASPDAFWKIKFELLGLGTILTVQVFYYSQALLYRSLNMNYLSMRSFLYLVAAALIAYSLACRRGKVHIQISRQAAFKSVVLFAVGAYLLLLGLLGEGMQHFGVYFSRTVTISLAFLFGIGLLILLFSERIRREIKGGTVQELLPAETRLSDPVAQFHRTALHIPFGRRAAAVHTFSLLRYFRFYRVGPVSFRRK